VKVLVAYDGSNGADAAIATAAKLLAGSVVEAIVLSVWEPMMVSALHAARFGGPLAVATDASEVDDHSAQQAQKLAEHGARLAGSLGFPVADDRDVSDAIVGEASELDVDGVVLGARGLTGVRAFVGSVSTHVLQRLASTGPDRPARMGKRGRRQPGPTRCGHDVDRELMHQQRSSHGYHDPELQPDRTPARAHGARR